MIGNHAVLLYADPTGAGTPLDISCLVDDVSIRHGRDDTESQPEASSATINVSTNTADETLPYALEIGAVVKITTTLAGDPASVRFVGRVTDVNTGWDEAGAATPDNVSAQVIAVSQIADLGRRIVGDAPFPQELDGARIARIMSLAGVTLDPLFSDPGTVQILPRDIDSQPALSVAHGTAASGGGLVWNTREAQIRYADADHRRGTQPALSLDACDVLVSPNWRRSTEGLVNRVSIGYGATPEEGEQPRYIADRPDSAAKYGRYELSTETELALQPDAERMGQLLLTRNSSPVWLLSELPIAVKDLDLAQTRALLGLDVHSLLDLTGLPTAGTVPTHASLWVEGWSETLTWGDHEITLIVSGYCRTVPAPRWNDLDPALTWDGTSTLVATNRHTNPGAENPTLGPWASGATGSYEITRNVTAPITGTASIQTRRIGALSGGASSVFVNQHSGASRLFVSPGTTVTTSIIVRTTVASRRAFLQYQWRLADNNLIVSTPIVYTPCPTPGDYVLTITATAPDLTSHVSIVGTVNTNSGNALLDEIVLWDKALIQFGPEAVVPYFDGDTPDDDTGDTKTLYAWTGTPHGSNSTRTEISGGYPGTWDDASCMGPIVDRGRWDDVPATTRWNQVPPSTTWDTWN